MKMRGRDALLRRSTPAPAVRGRGVVSRTARVGWSLAGGGVGGCRLFPQVKRPLTESGLEKFKAHRQGAVGWQNVVGDKLSTLCKISRQQPGVQEALVTRGGQRDTPLST